MSNTKVWAPSNTGTKYHAFLGSRDAKPGNLRAACRVSTQRREDAMYVDQSEAFSLCARCLTLYTEAEARSDYSMMPATEDKDLGYVAPTNERQDVAAEPEAIERPEVPAGTEADPVIVGGDKLVRTGEHWAMVTLSDGRTYVVSLTVHRKGDSKWGHVLVDNAIFWAERHGSSTGPVRSAAEDSYPRSVGGRIWQLLRSGGIA